MADSVTLSGSGGATVSIPASTNASFLLAKHIADAIAAAGVDITNGVFGGPVPAPPTGKAGEIIFGGDAAGQANIPDGYSFVVNNANAPVTITASNTSYLSSGTVGGTFFGIGNNTVAASDGNNLVVLGTGKAFMVGAGDGNDTVFASGSGTQQGGGGANLMFNTDKGTDSKQVFISTGHDTVIGGGGSDTVASFQDIVVYGTKGNLLVEGPSTDQTVVGGAGNTTIFGAARGIYFEGSGSNLFVTGSGSDTIISSSGSDTIFGGSGQDLVFGGSGSLLFIAGSGAATVFGGAGGTFMVGSTGDNNFTGGAGNDTLFAGAGTNTLIGGAGDDLLFANSGSTTLTGGAGSDVFFFAKGSGGGKDLITDFTLADKVSLIGYGANAVASALGTATVTSAVTGVSTTIQLSDSTKITFANVTNLNASNFL
jgi:large repetitive protein